MPQWPVELDAAIAAPEFHRLALENGSVRVFETRIGPGEIVPLHTHEWPAAYYVLAWSDFVRRDAEGAVVLDTRSQGIDLKVGQGVWSEPLGPHTLENIGDSCLHIISVEIKPSTA